MHARAAWRGDAVRLLGDAGGEGDFGLAQPELVAREIENLIAGKFQPLYQWLMANQTHHGM